MCTNRHVLTVFGLAEVREQWRKSFGQCSQAGLAIGDDLDFVAPGLKRFV